MRYLVTTEALMSGIRATTSTGPGLDRPSMASWTPEHQPAWTSRLMLITECGRLALAAHARSAAMRGIGNLGVHPLRRAEPGDMGVKG